MTLSREQLNFFDTFGYLLIRQLFSPDEMGEIIEGFEWSIQNYGEGRNHDGKNRTTFPGPIEHTPEMCTILDHPSILGLIGGILGEDFNYAGGDGNYYSGNTNWHPDGNWGQLFAAKTAFYLDPLTRDTGAVRLIPGSHRSDHFIHQEQIDVNNSLELFGIPPTEFPGNIAVETDPGDIVIFNHDLYHASFGGGNRRRMFTINCTRQAKTPEDLEIAHRHLKGLVNWYSAHSAGGSDFKTGAGVFYPTVIDTADENRMVHLRQPMEIHGQLFPDLARDVVSQESVSDA